MKGSDLSTMQSQDHPIAPKLAPLHEDCIEHMVTCTASQNYHRSSNLSRKEEAPDDCKNQLLELAGSQPQD